MQSHTRMGRPPTPVTLTATQRRDLERWATGRTVSHQLVVRARIVLACADGGGTKEVAERVGVTPQTVSRWRKRFAQGGTDALHDLPRPNTDRKLSDEKVEELIRTTLQTKPKGQTHWSSRQLAKKLGISQSSVSRVWRAFRLKPHRQETFRLSTDEQDGQPAARGPGQLQGAQGVSESAGRFPRHGQRPSVVVVHIVSAGMLPERRAVGWPSLSGAAVSPSRARAGRRWRRRAAGAAAA